MLYKSATLLEASKDVVVILNDGNDTAKIFPVSRKNKIHLTGVRLLENDTIELLYNQSCEASSMDAALLQVMQNQDQIADLYNQLAAGGTNTGGGTGGTSPLIGNFSNVSGDEDPIPTVDHSDEGMGTFTYVT